MSKAIWGWADLIANLQFFSFFNAVFGEVIYKKALRSLHFAFNRIYEQNMNIGIVRSVQIMCYKLLTSLLKSSTECHEH